MQKIFLAQVEQLRSMLEWIRTCLAKMEWDASTLRKVDLASEEALINIIRHAYRGQSEKIEIEVKLFPKSHAEITIRDNGPPFNPLKAEQPDLSSSLEQREAGGLGIYLMRQSMDEVRYRRDGDKNILTLVKKANHSSQKK